jgi:hypothetical protein
MESGLLRVRLGCCALVCFGFGCNQPEGAATDTTGSSRQRPAVVTEHHFQPPLRAQDTGKPVGSDCSEHGADGCASKLCLHTTASRSSGYVCSKPCVGNESCPASWRCAHTYPSAEGALCVPVNAAL